MTTRIQRKLAGLLLPDRIGGVSRATDLDLALRDLLVLAGEDGWVSLRLLFAAAKRRGVTRGQLRRDLATLAERGRAERQGGHTIDAPVLWRLRRHP